MKAKKHLGQNFLTSHVIAELMARVAGVGPSDVVVEVGPGKGIITRELLKTGARVVAVEKDAELAERLDKSPNLEVITGDILKCDINSLVANPYTLVANLPYYITGHFLRKFLESDNQPKKMVLILQREVAERIVALDGKQSILSISVNAYGECRIIKHISPGSFSPSPNVESSLLEISNISKDFFKGIDEKRFFEIVRAGFAHKRKLLKSNIKDLVSDSVRYKCLPPDKTGLVSDTVRAEDITKETWRCFVKVI